MLKNGAFNIVWVKASSKVALDFSAKPNTTINYTGEQVTIKLNQ